MKSAIPPQEVEHLFAAGWAALQGGSLSEAEESFLGVLVAAPTHVDALNGLGTVYFHEKRLDEAQACHEKALKQALGFYGTLPAGRQGKKPDHVDWDAPHDRALVRAMHGLALVSFRRGDLKDAEKRFSDLIKLNPKDNTGAKLLLNDIRKGRKSWDTKG